MFHPISEMGGRGAKGSILPFTFHRWRISEQDESFGRPFALVQVLPAAPYEPVGLWRPSPDRSRLTDLPLEHCEAISAFITAAERD